MQDYNRYTLGDIVNTQVLQDIQDKFAETTGLAAVIVDLDGKPVTKPSNFTSFCSYLRTHPGGLARCMACDDGGGRKAQELHRPYVYHCHSGLTDLAAPIIVQGEYLGAFLAGQVILSQEGFDAKKEMFHRVASLGLDRQLLSDCFDLIEVIPENKLKAAADLIYIMANYIVEMGMANIAQQRLMTEIKAKADLENMLRATELKALQSQINPHFLFNTLNTIARLALLEGANKTQEIVYALSDLLRNNLRDIEETRTIDEEIKSIKDYLIIQKARFGDRIQTHIDISPELYDIAIPALSLQPLVENSIVHGLEPKRDGGEIRISGRIEEDRVVLAISDTGVGVSRDRINSLFRAEKRKATKGQSTGLGLINVHKRIQHYFGAEFGLRMDSRIGEGTVIELHLPVQYQS